MSYVKNDKCFINFYSYKTINKIVFELIFLN